MSKHLKNDHPIPTQVPGMNHPFWEVWKDTASTEPAGRGPLISIITCTLNSEAFLEKTLRSVETQSYQNFEHIFNDSFSTDRTMQIIEDYIARNGSRYPIKLIFTEPKGVAAALNQATQVASGEIIHYLHSDDYYCQPDSLEKAASYFRDHPDCVWLTGNFMLEFKGEIITIPHTRLLKFNPKAAISIMNFIHHENTFVKREMIDTYGGFCEAKDMNVEFRLWLRMVQDHQPLVINDQFTVFIVHKGSTSTGSVWNFSKAIVRGFNTLHQEKVFPLIGYYEHYEFYKNLRRITTWFKKTIYQS